MTILLVCQWGSGVIESRPIHKKVKSVVVKAQSSWDSGWRCLATAEWKSVKLFHFGYGLGGCPWIYLGGRGVVTIRISFLKLLSQPSCVACSLAP